MAKRPAPGRQLEEEQAVYAWSDLQPEAQRHIVAEFLSTKFVSLRAMCEYYKLAYFSIHKAFNRRNLLAERKKFDEKARENANKLAEAERTATTASKSVLGVLESKLSLMELTDAQLRGRLLQKKMTVDQLLDINKRLTDDVSKLLAGMERLGKLSAELRGAMGGAPISSTDDEDDQVPFNEEFAASFQMAAQLLIQQKQSSSHEQSPNPS